MAHFMDQFAAEAEQMEQQREVSDSPQKRDSSGKDTAEKKEGDDRRSESREVDLWPFGANVDPRGPGGGRR